MRPSNFSAGPAAIPVSVLEQARDELLDYKGTGMSLMEISHRSKPFLELLDHVRATLIELVKIPDTHDILFMQGGAHFLFSAIPLNLLGDKKKADYLVTGNWSGRAAEEAKKYCEVNIVCKPTEYNTIPEPETWKLSEDAAYVYYCDNETVKGTEFTYVPEVGDKPLVVDMSSNFLSRPIDVSKYGVIFACAQKNFGMAGLTIAIVRKDLLGKQRPDTPMLLDFGLLSREKSIFNTPTTYAIYIAGLIFDWMKEQGGLSYFDELSKKKSKLIYDFIEESNGFYICPVVPEYRSRMNVRINLQKEEDVPEWVSMASKRGLLNLKGHRSVGGLRASIYNAVTYEDCEKLVAFMKEYMELKREN